VRVRSLDGEQIVISNSKLLDQQIRNLTGVEDRRVLITLDLIYANDPALLARLPELLRSLVEAHADCRFDHAWLIDFTLTSITLELLFHVTGNFETMAGIRHRIMLEILSQFKALGIIIHQPISVGNP
jgi:small-conductance mechanosensitive channel